MEKKYFSYAFQINKLQIFEADYYKLGDNDKPYFSTSAESFRKGPKTDYSECGQAQEILPHGTKAYQFYKDFDYLHCLDLNDDQYIEIAGRIEELKKQYNYIEKPESEIIRDKDANIRFYDIVELSKIKPKKQ